MIHQKIYVKRAGTSVMQAAYYVNGKKRGLRNRNKEGFLCSLQITITIV